jgi:hypothetical protein
MLDKIADISFTYSDIKEGKRTIGYHFKFYKTNNTATALHNVERVEEIFELLQNYFQLSKTDKSRLTGIMNNYQFTFLKSIINTHYMDIKDSYEQMKDIPNAIQKVILDNYDYLFTSDSKDTK